MLPFVAGGGLAVAQAVHLLRRGRWGEGAMLLAVGALAVVVGLALVRRAHAQAADADAVQRRAEADPGHPWRWRPDWAAGTITHDPTTGATTLGLLAVVWNLAALPAAWIALEQWPRTGDRMLLLVLCVPVVGVTVVAAAARAGFRRLAHGVSTLRLGTVPGVPGGALAGEVHVPVRLDAPGGVQVTLSAIRSELRTTGRSRGVREAIAWQAAERFAARRGPRDGETTVPFRFALPADAPPTSPAHWEAERVCWRVEVAAEVPGVDHAARFEVPVFPLADGAPPDRDDTAATAPLRPDATEPPLPLQRTATGVTLRLGPARNPGPALPLAALAVVWLAFTAVMPPARVPLVFVVTFGAVGTAMLAGAVVQLAEVTVAEADGTRLRVQRSLAGIPWGFSIAAGDLRAFDVEIGFTSGQTPYHRVVARDRQDRRHVVAGGIRERWRAEWLADELGRATGVGLARYQTREIP